MDRTGRADGPDERGAPRGALKTNGRNLRLRADYHPRMGLLDTLKSVIGLDASESGGRPPSERGEPDAGSEAAVKGTESGAAEPAEATGPGSQDEELTDAGGETDGTADADAAEEVGGGDADATGDTGGTRTDATGQADEGETAAAGTDAAGSTGSITEEPPGDEDVMAEPSDAAGPDPTDTAQVPAEDETPADVAEDEDAADLGKDDTAADAEDVEAISGVGPAYAARLHEAGIETVTDLATADPADVADETDVSETRVGRWIDRARDG